LVNVACERPRSAWDRAQTTPTIFSNNGPALTQTAVITTLDVIAAPVIVRTVRDDPARQYDEAETQRRVRGALDRRRSRRFR